MTDTTAHKASTQRWEMTDDFAKALVKEAKRATREFMRHRKAEEDA